MTRVSGVVTKDTGRDITDLINSACDDLGIDALAFMAGAIAEAGLREHAAREQAWPDVSYGLWQSAVEWIGPEVALTRASDGTALDSPANRAAAKRFFFDAANAISYTAPRYANLCKKYGDALEAWCRWNWPSIPGSQNPNRQNYVNGFAAAQAYAATDPSPLPSGGFPPPLVDLRGQLPTAPQYGSYNQRPMDAVTGVTIHYTAGGQGATALDIATYQISPAAAPQTGTGMPFPGIAYHFLVDGAGNANLCWNLDQRVWHSGAVVNGVSRNMTHIGVCFTGTGNPSGGELAGMAAAVVWCEQQLGRQLAVEGHKDAPYATTCPGPNWPNWKPQLLAAIASRRGEPGKPDVSNGFSIGSGFVDFLIANPEYGKARHDELDMMGGTYIWTTPTAQHPKGCLLIWRAWLNQVRVVAWD